MPPRHLLPLLPALILALVLACARPAPAQTLDGTCTQGDCQNGQGTFRESDGTTYTGAFSGGKLNGPGVRLKPDGRRYAGPFQNGLMHGQGAYVWPSGDRYEGEFRDNDLHGRGIFHYASGDRYEGEFRSDTLNGRGNFIFKNGERFVGEFRDGKRNGHGVYTWPTGVRYVGEFTNDKMHGPGIMYHPNGNMDRGLFENDKFVMPLAPQAFNEEQARAELARMSAAQPAPAAPQAPPPAPVQQVLAQQAAPAKPVQQIAQQAQGQKQRRVALVIGNGAYAAAPLKNPVNDARDMATALKGLGFEVIARENASLAQMEEGLEEFWKRLRLGGVGLFYFAGHGIQVQGRNYLVPVDARLSVEQDAKYRCLDAGQVLGRMENAGNGLNLVILDACRNNPFARSWRSAEQGLAKMDAPRGSIIAYATAPDSVAADGQGRNGVYTEKLLKAMRTPGQPVELMFKRVRDEVMRATGDKQVPWESTSLRGDFSFAGQ